jgi:chromatin segregation and condensation protein Rec8/ScpA/Scc1 (kleisin family)
MAVLRLDGYQGSLTDLAAHLRKRRIDALSISARELVRQLRAAWQPTEVPWLDAVADELPVAAWVVRQKGLSLIPGSAGPEPDSGEPAAAWEALPALAAILRDRRAAAYAWYGPPRWPRPAPPEIPDATPWRLRWAWPPGRPTLRPPAPQVVVPSRPLWRRGLLLAHWLRRHGGRGDYHELVQGLSREDQVEVFLVVLALWARRRLALRQDGVYGAVTIRVRRRLQALGEGGPAG